MSQLDDTFDGFGKNNKEPQVEEIEEEIDENPVYVVGDFVNHKTYGDGIVVSLSNKAGSIIGQICFTSQGTIKSFDMSHPSIKKRNRK